MANTSQMIVGFTFTLFAVVNFTVLAGENKKEPSPPLWILQDHAKRWSFPEKREIVEPSKAKYIVKDINGDGRLDFFIYDLGGCGSAGCSGDVYIHTTASSGPDKRDYCYAGGGSQEILKRTHSDLKCRDELHSIE